MLKKLITFILSEPKHASSPHADIAPLQELGVEQGQDSFATSYALWRARQPLTLSECEGIPDQLLIEGLKNRDGYIREFCLLVIEQRGKMEALPWLLSSLNDYVPVIRKKAHSLCTRYLNNSDATTIIRILPILIKLKTKSRIDSKYFELLVTKRLSSADGMALLLSSLENRDQRISWASWQFALTIFDWGFEEKVRRAVKTRNPHILKQIGNNIRTLDDEALQFCLSSLPSVTEPNFRRAVLQECISRQLISTEKLFELCLEDKASGVRWIARKHIVELGFSNQFLGKCLEEIAAPKSMLRQLNAIEGMYELRCDDLQNLLRPFLQSKTIRIWEKSIWTIYKLNKQLGKNYILQSLLEEAPKYTRCFKLIRTERLNVEFDIIGSFASQHRNEVHALRCLIQHASTIGGWRSLEVLTLSQIFEEVSQKACTKEIREFLWSWCKGQNFTLPTKTQLKKITSWLQSQKLIEDTELIRELQFHIEAERKHIEP